jgi:hypothetical protein
MSCINKGRESPAERGGRTPTSKQTGLPAKTGAPFAEKCLSGPGKEHRTQSFGIHQEFRFLDEKQELYKKYE